MVISMDKGGRVKYHGWKTALEKRRITYSLYNEGQQSVFDDWTEDRVKLQADKAKLVEALFDHRADLHCYSRRPCPTCRNSAEVLGITDKVPYCCARQETDDKARAVLKGAP